MWDRCGSTDKDILRDRAAKKASEMSLRLAHKRQHDEDTYRESPQLKRHRNVSIESPTQLSAALLSQLLQLFPTMDAQVSPELPSCKLGR